MIDIESILLILIIISSVAVITNYIRLPYTIVLVLVGLALGYSNLIPKFQLTPDLIFSILLPVLIFEGALNISVSEFLKNLKLISLLAVLGLLFAGFLFAVGIHYIFAISLGLSALVGFLICATDPVSVIAIFRGLGIKRDLSTILEGESLLNDGVAIVIFSVLIGSLTKGSITLFEPIKNFFIVTIGGAAFGIIIGVIASLIIRGVRNNFVIITVTTILAYSTNILAIKLHLSGIIAIVSSAIVLSEYGFKYHKTQMIKIPVISFWEYLAFIVNSIIFLLIGIEIAHVDILLYIYPIIIAWLLSIGTRAVMIYALVPIASFWKTYIPLNYRHMLVWGGLRGSVALALALSIPQQVEERPFLLCIIFGVVLLSLVVQGTTTNLFIRFLGLSRKSQESEELELYTGMLISTQEAIEELKKCLQRGELTKSMFKKMLKEYNEKLHNIENNIHELEKKYHHLEKERITTLYKSILLREKSALIGALNRGLISRSSHDKLVEKIDEKISELLEDNIEDLKPE
jgi:CPA1 family monovalent cation:H+ antiporter